MGILPGASTQWPHNAVWVVSAVACTSGSLVLLRGLNLGHTLVEGYKLPLSQYTCVVLVVACRFQQVYDPGSNSRRFKPLPVHVTADATHIVFPGYLNVEVPSMTLTHR